MNQRFEADCWKICAHLLKDDQKQNQLALYKGLQEQAKKEGNFHSKFRAGGECEVYGNVKEQINSHRSGRVVLLPSKRVGADEVRLNEHVVCFLEQWRSSSEGVFSSVPTCESTLLHRSTKGFYGSCWEKMPNKWLTQDWLLQHDTTPWHTDLWLFPVPNQKIMVVVSDRCTSPS